jgi:CHAD domain-containing protein
MDSAEISEANERGQLARGSFLATLLEPEQLLPALPNPGARIARSAPAIAPISARTHSLSITHLLAISLGNRWQVYRDEHRRFREQVSEESVHELRVASRRLLAQLDLLAGISHGGKTEKARRMLKRCLKNLSGLRDIQVQRLFIEKHLKAFPELAVLFDYLARNERRLTRSAANKVRGFKMRKFEKWIAATLQELDDGKNDARVASLLVETVEHAYVDVVRQRRAIHVSDVSTIHRTRLSFKKFRYMMECLSPGITGLKRSQLRRLTLYQRKMGAIQDLETMQCCVAGFLEKHEASKDQLRPFCRQLQRKRNRAIASFIASADRIFEFWPPGLHRRHDSVPTAA